LPIAHRGLRIFDLESVTHYAFRITRYHPPMQVPIKLFGPAAQRAGSREIRVTLEGERPTCQDLRAALARAAPALGDMLPVSRFAVNQEFAGDDDPVRSGDEVALIAMVSGG
jgi:molybdopterin converting factor small subunit